jgi:putative ABC transport system ATP-binding protein
MSRTGEDKTRRAGSRTGREETQMSGGTESENVLPLVELCSVSKGYVEGERRHDVLVDVDATIRRGEIVVLLGRSGSGKSTLLNLISGIDLPDGGDVLVNGKAINRMTERERTLFRRDPVGFVFQFFNLIPTLTVLENLLLPLELAGHTDTAGTDGAVALLRRVGLVDRVSSYPDKLSGGEQQRVAVARALVHDPCLVLADEPTGNLDLDTGSVVLDLLDTLVRSAGKTMIMVTHSRQVAGLTDRLMTVRDGRLVEIGHGELT